MLGLQHELAQLMHVFWLSKHDAHCSVTENPIVPYLCAFVGTMFMNNKNDLLSEKNKFKILSLCLRC